MSSYPIDALRHHSPLVLISGLQVPDDDDRAHAYSWSNYTTNVPTDISSIATNPLLQAAEPTVGSDESSVAMPELFWKFSSKSHPPNVWLPQSIDASKKSIPYLLNVQFVSSRSDFKLLPAEISTPSPTSSAKVSLDGDRVPSTSSTPSSHSILSPLSPSSELYPDGLISERWIQKYLHLLPSSFISLHHLDTSSSQEDQLESDANLTKRILGLKSQLAERNIKLIVIVVSSVLPSADPSLNDRIYYLRKNTGLAARTGLFFLPPSTEIELEALGETVCQLAYSYAQDFYTSTAKRIRKKRSKNKTVLSGDYDPTITTSPLSHAGWEVRYNYKLAALAEFRQEVESAIKLYETTYESALELFETLHPLTEITPHRWIQIRQFLDLLAYKITKLYFYLGQGNHAYKKYTLHTTSVTSIIAKKGFDFKSSTPSILHWRASLDTLVANLIDLTEGALISYESPLAYNPDIFVPGDNLPRSGYFYLGAAQNLLKLKNYTEESKDPYFAIYNTEALTLQARKLLGLAAKDFSCGKVANSRSVASTSYYMGEVCLHNKDWKDALQHLHDAARIYRQDRWAPLLRLVLLNTVKAAKELGLKEDTLMAELELAVLDDQYAITSTLHEDTAVIDINQEDSLSTPPSPSSSPFLSFFQSSFAFATRECFLGLPIDFQVTLKCAVPPAWPTDFHTLQKFTIGIAGELSSVTIKHNPALEKKPVISIPFSQLRLDKETNIVEAEANLEFKPEEVRAFHLSQLPRQLGDAKFVNFRLTAQYNSATLNLNLTPKQETSGVIPWYSEANGSLAPSYIRNPIPYRTKLLPRPSLVTVILDTRSSMAIGELVRRPISIKSTEKEAVIVTIQAKAVTNKDDAADFSWVGETDKSDTITDFVLEPNQVEEREITLSVPNSSTSVTSITLEFFVSYRPKNDVSGSTEEGTEMVIKDVVTHKLDIVRPFAIYYDLLARVHPTAWPSFFNPDIEGNLALFPRIHKRWELKNSLLCLLEDSADFKTSVEVLKTEINLTAGADAHCEVVEGLGCKNKTMKHNDSQKFSYILDSCRKSEDAEVRIVEAEASISIFWRRNNVDGSEGPTNVYKVPALKITLPLIEPRVIVTMRRATSIIEKKKKLLLLKAKDGNASATNGADDYDDDRLSRRAFKIRYYIENATAHMLTYSVTMGSSENFAYTGPKQLTVRMLPFSRRGVEYVMYPLGRGAGLTSSVRSGTQTPDPQPKQQQPSSSTTAAVAANDGYVPLPQLRVYDVNYKRILTPLPASTEFKVEKNRLLIRA